MKSKLSPFFNNLFLFFILVFFSGCVNHNHYQRIDYSESKNQLQDQDLDLILSSTLSHNDLSHKKYSIIVHSNDEMKVLVNPKIENDERLTFSGLTSLTSGQYLKYSASLIKDFNRIGIDHMDDHKQIHLFVDSSNLDAENGIDISKIWKVETLDRFNKTRLRVFGVVFGGGVNAVTALLLATVAVVGLVYFATAAAVAIICGCPDVYIGDHFEGNLYPGATNPGLEKSDYIIIGSEIPPSEPLVVTLANNKNEHLYTNKLGLITVDHPYESTILTTQNGEIHSIKNLVGPYSALSENMEVSHILSEKDEQFYSFNDGVGDDELNSISLWFEKPKDKIEGKLVLNVKNTDWQTTIFSEVSGLLGDKYQSWYDKKWEETKEGKMMNLSGQGVFLEVYIKNGKTWKLIDQIKTVGAQSSRDVLVTLDLTEHDTEELEIKLSSGFMFWELDFVGVDYSEDVSMEINYVDPIAAVDTHGDNYLAEILDDDHLYLEQIEEGHNVDVTFPAFNGKSDLETTLILNGVGHYRLLDTYVGNTQYLELLKLKRPGGVSKYSKKRFEELLEDYVALKR